MSQVECICTCARARPVFQISQTAGRIAFKVCAWIGTHWIRALHMSEVECICTCARARPVFQISQTAGRVAFKFLCVNRDPLDNCFAHVWCGVHLHVRTCTPLGGTERRLIKLPVTRTTNLRFAALPEKRCLAGNRRLVECTPLGGTERRLIKLPVTRTTNFRFAALPEKRCLAGNRRLVEHETTTIR